jgi:uncharacterized repeat protein (TIGR03803 family)
MDSFKLGRYGLLLAVLLAFPLIFAGSLQAQTETVLYNFCSQPNCLDGASPSSSLTSDGVGNFYGTTAGGGVWGYGTVYELSPDGNGGWNESVLYSFSGGADGANPFSSVIFDKAGNLYGTTVYGGVTGCGYLGIGCGVIFELIPSETSWTENVLYTFCSQPGCTDGYYPSPWSLVLSAKGYLYGTTSYGGSAGGGTVFELSPSGGGWTQQVIYQAPLPTYDGVNGLVLDALGNLYGTAGSGSTYDVLELTPNGSGWTANVIFTFPWDIEPVGNITLDKAGNLYGTTTNLYGYSKNTGRVYKLIHQKNGRWVEKGLYSFKGNGKGQGTYPQDGIAFDASGNIYGIARTGYDGGNGFVFELEAPGGKGKYQEKILCNLNVADTGYPYSSLILDTGGNLYGASGRWGAYGGGDVFEVTP